jgi:hypothetical protein
MTKQRIFAGQTLPGETDWQVRDETSIQLFVDTGIAGFSTTPVYVCSIGGANNHWTTLGGHAVYKPTERGFQVNLRLADGCTLTPAQANSHQWHINWIGVEKLISP